MIPILAWRNIWRNPTRSLVLIAAIALGVWAAISMTGFATGMINSYISNAIQNVVSHIQIHHPEYKVDNDVKFYIPDADEKAGRMRSEPNIRGVSVRTLVSGMIASSQSARGIVIKAVDPEEEARVTGMDQKIIEGEYLSGEKRNELLVSESLAEKLAVKLRSKLVITFQDMNGEITAAAFRVVGIFRTGTKPFDESHVFAVRQDVNRLLSASESAADTMAADPLIAHEMAILTDDSKLVDGIAQGIQQQFPDLLVETYREISPDLQLYESQIDYVSLIYLTIIMLALIFGIVNTMLMAVLERVRELGMLMAIGMNKLRVFLMILLEALLLGMLAAPLGLLLGYGTISYVGNYGLDLSAYSNTLQTYGMSEQIYFAVQDQVYWQFPIIVLTTALVAAIYPAFKAVRLRPVEAIRKI